MAQKSTKDLYKDLEKYAKEEAKKTQGFQVYRSKKSPHQKGFPWGTLLLGGVVLIGFFTASYYMELGSATKYARVIASGVGHTAKTLVNEGRFETPSFSGLSNENSTSQTTANSNVANPRDPSTVSAAAKSAEQWSTDDLVRIDGKYYRKTPDNIYLINGRRVFFKAEKPAKAPHEQVADTIQENANVVKNTFEKVLNNSHEEAQRQDQK